MSKKKKKKKQLKKIDKNLNIKYADLIKEIDDMQKYIKKIDKKAKKRAKRKAGDDKKLYKQIYKADMERAKARYKVVNENESLFDNLESTIDDVKPAAKILSRLIAGLIVTILSIEVVQLNITPAQMNSLDKLYRLSMRI